MSSEINIDNLTEDDIIAFIVGVDKGLKDPDFMKHLVKRLVIIMGLTTAQGEMVNFVDDLSDLI